MSEELWCERVQFDLTCLADPGTPVECSRDANLMIVEWTMRGRKQESELTHSFNHGIRATTAEWQTVPFAAYLARMADLRQLAQMISQSSAQHRYVNVQATADDRTESAVDLLGTLVKEGDLDRTRVVMLKGDAGSGKTQILRKLVRRQAEAYLHGQENKLLLYVNAQGRALARLDEALAVSLQDLRAAFTYHAVASLARWDLIVPVIDGFDELLGVSGYEEAFRSLGDFLERLRGQGQLLASARSVYYEEEFLARADLLARSGEQAWTHVPVSVEPWSTENQEEYLQLSTDCNAAKTAQLRHKVQSVFSVHEEFAKRPLFFTKTVELALDDPNIDPAEDLLTTLVDGFLSREINEKLLDGTGVPLLNQEQITILLGEIAQEMWTVHTRELDPASIKEVAAMVVDDLSLPQEARQVVIERAPTLAFLSRGEAQGNVAFEHESFFFDFLARSIVSGYLDDDDASLKLLLGSSPLPDDVASRAGFHLTQQRPLDDVRLGRLLTRLGQAGAATSFRSSQIRENAGRLVRTALGAVAGQQQEVHRQEIATLIFPGGSFDGVVFRECRFDDVEFRRTNLANTRFFDCVARRVKLIEPRVAAGTTHLGLHGLDAERDVVGVRLADGGDVTYSPNRIQEVLSQCGLSLPAEVAPHPAPKYHEMMERLMRAYRRANPICLEDPHLKPLFKDDEWPALRRALEDNGIATVEKRSTGGNRKEFLRRQYLPEQIMAGISQRQYVDPHVSAFWKDLASH